MTAPRNHIHITEREVAHVWPDGRKDDAAWEDCGYVSLIMFLRIAYRPDLPATHSFAELIRARVEGPLGGSTPAELEKAALTIGAKGPKTAGVVLKRVTAANLWAAMKPGTVACVAGSMDAFPTGHQLRRFDPSFHSGHQILAARLDTLDRVYWDDPEAPTGTYQGQWVSKADFMAFVNKLNSISFVAPIPVPVAAPAPVPAPTPVPVPTPAPVPAPAAPTYTDGWNDALSAARSNLLAVLPAKR